MPAQKDIASQASTTRETVTRAISQLVADGIAERRQKSIYVHDRKRFEHLASALDPDWGEESAR
jgi:DNA-binding GntR family transcriptional regulator